MAKRGPKPKAESIDKQLNAAKKQLKLAEIQSTLSQIKAQDKIKKDSLATYEAANKGRRNRDWKANNNSADATIIPDVNILNARARQGQRDSWIIASIVKAFVRNIVGVGIRVVPNAINDGQKPYSKHNKLVASEYHRWESSKLCDIERAQTFPQKQALAVAERATVGEHFIGWSYERPTLPDGSTDKTKPVGLKLQSFEPEQLDQRLYTYEGTGNQVRGGIEIDRNGAAVAYHFYVRNPNDYQFNANLESVRIDRARIWHYYKQERVLQTRGVTPLTSVLQDARDLKRHQEYTLWKVVMEACIGVIFNKNTPPATPTGGFPATPTFAAAAGDTGYTYSGMPEVDFVPGMTIQGQVGETVTGFNTGNPGSSYEPFQDITLRAISAGAGMSVGEVSRQSSGNYSVARQDMLRDRQEWEPEQNLLVDDLIKPIFEQWYVFAALEGRFEDSTEFDLDDFLKNTHLWTNAAYIPPPQTWIDPEKEANAYAVLLANRLITREEIIALRGERYEEQIFKISTENKEIEQMYDLSLPENNEDKKLLTDIVKTQIATRLNTVDSVTNNSINEQGLLKKIGVPGRAFQQPDLPVADPTAAVPGGSGIQTHGADGTFGSTGAKPPVPVLSPAKKASNDLSLPVVEGETSVEPPQYQYSEVEAVSCETCSFFKAQLCTKFNYPVHPDYVCLAWQALPSSKTAPTSGGKGFPVSNNPDFKKIENDTFDGIPSGPRGG